MSRLSGFSVSRHFVPVIGCGGHEFVSRWLLLLARSLIFAHRTTVGHRRSAAKSKRFSSAQRESGREDSRASTNTANFPAPDFSLIPPAPFTPPTPSAERPITLPVEFDGKEYPARAVLADVRSGIAMLKVDMATPALPIGKSEQLEVATPVITIGYPLDLPETPSFGMIAGFDRKFLGRYFSTTHLRVNLPTQRGEAGAPLLNFKGEVVGILVSSIENGSACYALPIDAAEKIRNDFVRFGEARHGWIGINVARGGRRPRKVRGPR